LRLIFLLTDIVLLLFSHIFPLITFKLIKPVLNSQLCVVNLTFKSVQHAKKVVSDGPGLVDFAIELVNSVFNLPDRQVMFFEEFK